MRPRENSNAVPVWVWLLVAGGILTIPLLCCGGLLLRGVFQGFTENRAAPGGTKCGIGESVDLGDVTITPVYARVGSLLVWHEFVDPTHTPPGLILHLEIRSRNPNRVISLHSQIGKAYVTDELGNRYEPLEFTGRFQPDGLKDPHIPRGIVRDLRSDRPTADTILFSRPVPGASKVTISLDGAAYGAAGTIEIVVSKEQFTPK